jgi:hypothetical protein
MMSHLLLQGLCGGGLVSQGWSASPQSSSLVIQGLCGPGLLLQGLGQGGATAYWPSGGLALGGSPPAGALAADTFTGAPGTALAAHAPDSGGSWSLASGYSGAAVLSDANRVRSNATAASLYVHSAVPASADLDVSADVVPVGSTGTQIAGVAGRVDPVANTFYSARYNCGLGRWELYRVVSGAYGLLAWSGGPGLSGPRRLTLRFAGSQIQLLVDGSAVITASDPTIAGPGRVGLWFLGSSTDAAGLHLDNWGATGGPGLAAYAPAASGGTGQGGASGVAAGLTSGPSGGLRLGGKAAAARGAVAAATGGMSLGGRGAAARSALPQAAGGLARGAQAPASARHTVPSAGGLSLGGRGPAAAGNFAHPAGGLGRGGRAGVARSSTVRSAGGLRLGGAVRAPRSFTVLAVGGPAHGGLTAAPQSLTVLASGGLSLGGRQASRDPEAVVYAVYGNDGAGGPINYATPLVLVGGTSWTTTALAAPGQYRFGVRVRAADSGLEEQNLDAAVELVLDASGRDVTDVPLPPLGIRALPLAAGAIRVEWTCPCTDPRRQPAGFHVYLGAPTAIDWSHPVADIAWSGGLAGSFAATVAGLTSGASYGVNVRSYNMNGEEPNTGVVLVTADGTPPAGVDGLSAEATSQE